VRGKHKNDKLLNSRDDLKKFFLFDLRSVWEEFPKLEKALTDNRLKNKAANKLIEIMDDLKSLGFRHDLHKSKRQVQEHIKWLADNGLEVQYLRIIFDLKDLEIVEDLSDNQRSDDQFYENYYRFWLKSCELMYLLKKCTFEDQKYWMVMILDNDYKNQRVTRGFDYILIDEFQDINLLDLNLIKLITDSSKAELTIVGDDDQAIFEWRYASPKFILEPEVYLKNSFTTFVLETNYRSPRNIVDISQKLIKNNKFRVDKSIKSFSDTNADIHVYAMPDYKNSLSYVVNYVHSNLRQNNESIAIIARKRSQIIPLQIIFASENISFYAAEDLNIFLSNAFNELKELLLLSMNFNSSHANVINDVLKLCDNVYRYPLRMDERNALRKHLIESHPSTISEGLKSLYKYGGVIKGKEGNSDDCYRRIFEVLQAKTVSECIYAIGKNFDRFGKDYGKSLDDIFFADPPFLYLGEYAERYRSDFKSFYEDIDLAISQLQASPDPNESEEVKDNQKWKLPLHLMTAFRTKGKEYDTIIILECNEDIWPHKLAQSEEELEAERRLFYVAFTRARKRAILLVEDSILGRRMTTSRYIREMGLEISDK
jgi:DNA helicase-2/ATP-dependent DNA helicase PcrA